MLIEALTGVLIGVLSAALFLGIVRLGLDRLNQGLAGSGGLAAMIGICLWLDGWILTAIPGFALGGAALLSIRAARR